MRAGAELVDPVTGLRTVFRETARDTAGGLLQVEWLAAPAWTAGADHLHPLQEERLEVLSGTLGMRVDGVERVRGPGDGIAVKPRSAHSAWNAGASELHLLVDFRPALRTEALLETMATLGRDGRTTARGMPRNPLLAAVILSHFADELQLVRPPVAVQNATLRPLAALGRVLGYRAEHPYSGEEPRVTQ